MLHQAYINGLHNVDSIKLILVPISKDERYFWLTGQLGNIIAQHVFIQENYAEVHDTRLCVIIVAETKAVK